MGNEQTTIIFSTENGIVALESPVKLKILELLRKGTKSFDELVEQSGKAKSTVSVHLDDLENLNLIIEKIYPGDKRKKYYMLSSVCLACSEMPMRNHYNQYLENIAISEVSCDSFIRHLFHTVRFGMEAYGFDPKPIMKRLGNDIGNKIGLEFESGNYEELLKELSVFWKEHNLGEMKIFKESHPVIFVTNCYHCGKMPNVGKTLCSMDEGILEGVFSSRLNLKYSVKEIECFGTGHDHCKFVVEQKKSDNDESRHNDISTE
ncbi:MAG: ArsR family transcriptional regulator [Candidatus Methanoperedens sp.]|nr:ArsR family transcriptional regulator [Candidatus Methanoperedens sp.]MCZ7359023.1 ArsR family transcriptional regulator [Candidatus Methanoperedens sp.]HLB71023.1 V4R domain-containing protein [Candidatus Methanoperedens sp.]